MDLYARVYTHVYAHVHTRVFTHTFTHAYRYDVRAWLCAGRHLCDTDTCLHAHVQVLGVELLKELVPRAQQSLRDDDAQLLECVEILHGDGRDIQCAGPFDAIHVGAAAQQLPQSLVGQLKAPGRMVVPVGGQSSVQDLLLVKKNRAGDTSQQRFCGVNFVPLR